jgi:glucan endo-1,6-beta-glucosidase
MVFDRLRSFPILYIHSLNIFASCIYDLVLPTMHFSKFAFLSLLSLTHAWLPGDKDLFGKHVDVPAGKGRTVKRWLPGSGKIRGVNLGSWLIMEPWMASSEWSSMGCGSAQSEFDCVSSLGQSAANSAFQKHWNSWITESDLNKMMDLNLNTIRIPVGYWIDESTVDTASEHFPQGGLTYLQRLCGWASDRGFYIIIDLHGAPGAQVPRNAFTGQVRSR